MLVPEAGNLQVHNFFYLNERDSLEHRLKREGYVEGIEVKNKGLYSMQDTTSVISMQDIINDG